MWSGCRDLTTGLLSVSGQDTGQVPKDLFVRYFEAELPHDREAFIKNIEQFEQAQPQAPKLLPTCT